MEKAKLVSIIIPTYNRAKFIPRALESCLRQTYPEIEILIVDDNSADETAGVVKSYKDSRIKYFLHNDNLGTAAARNTGLRNASGEFVTFLDDDDEWLPEKISHQLEIFKNKDPEIGLVFTNGYNEYANKVMINEKMLSGIIYNPKVNKFFPLRRLITPPSSWMLPKAVIDKIGDFDIAIGMNSREDEDYLVRLSLNYTFYFLNESLVTWHASENHTGVASAERIKNHEYFLQKHYDLIKKDKEYLFRFYKALGKDSISIDRIKSRKYLWRAFLMKPYDLSILSKLFRSFRNFIYQSKKRT